MKNSFLSLTFALLALPAGILASEKDEALKAELAEWANEVLQDISVECSVDAIANDMEIVPGKGSNLPVMLAYKPTPEVETRTDAVTRTVYQIEISMDFGSDDAPVFRIESKLVEPSTEG